MNEIEALEFMKMPRPGDSCIFCGDSPEVIGVFVTKDTVSFGTPKGKIRLIRYCLCSKCVLDSEASEKVEKILKYELSGGSL